MRYHEKNDTLGVHPVPPHHICPVAAAAPLNAQLAFIYIRFNYV